MHADIWLLHFCFIDDIMSLDNLKYLTLFVHKRKCSFCPNFLSVWSLFFIILVSKLGLYSCTLLTFYKTSKEPLLCDINNCQVETYLMAKPHWDGKWIEFKSLSRRYNITCRDSRIKVLVFYICASIKVWIMIMPLRIDILKTKSYPKKLSRNYYLELTYASAQDLLNI